MVLVGVKIHAATLTLFRLDLDDELGRGSPSSQMGPISPSWAWESVLQIHPTGEPVTCTSKGLFVTGLRNPGLTRAPVWQPFKPSLLHCQLNPANHSHLWGWDWAGEERAQQAHMDWLFTVPVWKEISQNKGHLHQMWLAWLCRTGHIEHRLWRKSFSFLSFFNK